MTTPTTMGASLTQKFMLATLAVVCVVLAGHVGVAVSRERRLFEEDMTHDARVLAGALVDPFRRTWAAEGRGAARALLHRAEASTGAVRVGWRRIDDVSPNVWFTPRVLREPLAAVSRRDTLGEPGYLVTAVRVDAPDGVPGAIFVRESLADERAYIHTSVRNHVIMLIALLALSGGGIWAVGRQFIGRPVDLLVGKARRAGAGDLTGPIVLRQRDELRELADEMNDMCTRLAETRRRLDKETEARFTAVDQLRHAERLATIGGLASGVAHELGTPLNVVQARAALVRSAKTPAEIEEQVTAILRQVDRMSQIIRGLLDFAKPTVARRARVDVKQVARATAFMLKPIAVKAGIEVRIADVEGAHVVGDEGQLQQVLTNLILNAVQAGKPGGHVDVGFECLPAAAAAPGPGGEHIDGPAVVVTVADDGPGMPDSVRRRVFEPFFTTKEVGKGTGLGLAVSHGIVREHGGYIAVVSDEGHGSTFSVTLPAAPAAQAKDATAPA